MNYNFIKKTYEKIPKQIKYVCSSIFINKIVRNKIYKKMYSDLDEFERLSEMERIKKQFDLLKETLCYAYEKVPYYHELFDSISFQPQNMKTAEDIQKIPLLTKDIAINADKNLLSSEQISCYETVTGGSSGRALKVILDKDSIYKERAFVNHFLAKYGYDVRKHRTVAFWGHNKGADYYYSPLKNEIVISPFKLFDENSFENVWAAIEKFNPTFIAGYPSAIYLFSQLMEQYKKKKTFNLIDFYAENYTPEIKAYCEKILGCKAISNYGHTERAVFAEEYPKGYLFNDLYGYTEFLPTENDGEYQIVCTGFISRKMPLIRYVTDDVVYFTEEGYAQILGHKFSEVCLISKTGGKIFKGALTMHIDVLKKVQQYQYVQYEPGKAFLDLVLIENLSENERRDIIEYLSQRCEGQLDIEIRIVDKVELTKRGKYNWAVNKIENGNKK